jgi:NAD(P)-dependent dehydrogenase (short-subunit alcohol dehydrogenase family)
VAIVTGATGALGRVAVKMLLDQGARVVSTYQTEESQKELVNYVGENAAKLIGVQADVTDETSVQALYQKVVSDYGRVDILLNIVGAFRAGSDIANTEESNWDFMMNVNLRSAFLCSKAALQLMVKQNYGRIVSISSRAAVEKRFRNKSGAYAISKMGIIVLTETIAEEFRKYDINANCIIPSTIDTPDNRRSMPDADFSKWIKPEEVAKVILFLVSDEAKVISGASVPVYGKA